MNQKFADLRGIGIQLSKLEKNVPLNNMLSNFFKQGFTKPETSVQPLESNMEISMQKETTVVDRGTNTESPLDVEANGRRDSNTPLVSKKSSDKSKRGRPKGSKNGLTSKSLKGKSNSSISQYFGKNKESGSFNKEKVKPFQQSILSQKCLEFYF